MTYLASDEENPEFLRHKSPLPPESASPYGVPARWYRIHVDYIPALIALCDYYVHEDAHIGTPEEKQILSQWWVDLQILLMTGDIVGTEWNMDIDDPFCAHIADCIDGGSLNSTLQNWQFAQQGMTDSKTIFPTSPAAEIVLVDTCDRSSCYAIIRQLLDLVDKAISDMLETVSAALNSVRVAEAVISAIPFVGALPVDEMLGFITLTTDIVISNYNSSYNQGVRQQYICDLWCDTVKNCALDLKGMGAYFFQRFTDEVFEIDAEDLIELLINGTWSGEETVHFMHGIVAYTLATGQAFAGLSPTLFLALIKSFYNDTDDDWQALCAECDTSTHVLLNFPESDYNFTVSADSPASWQPGVGFTCYSRPDTDHPGVRIECDLLAQYPIVRAKAVAEVRWGTSDNSLQVQTMILTDGVTPSIRSVKVAGQNGLVRTNTLELTRDIETQYIEIKFAAGSKYLGSWVKVHTLELWFADHPPFGWPEV